MNALKITLNADTKNKRVIVLIDNGATMQSFCLDVPSSVSLSEGLLESAKEVKSGIIRPGKESTHGLSVH